MKQRQYSCPQRCALATPPVWDLLVAVGAGEDMVEGVLVGEMEADVEEEADVAEEAVEAEAANANSLESSSISARFGDIAPCHINHFVLNSSRFS